jgi:BASS family bile acid:Na+ symporter
MTPEIINLLVTVTLIEMMVALGLGVKVSDLIAVAADWWLVTRAMLANYVVFPAITVVLLLLFASEPHVAVGFLIMAVCPGAPFGPPLTGIAKGDVPVAVGLMGLLAASSALLAPALLFFLVPLVAGGTKLPVNAGMIAGTLLVTQLLPLVVGLAVRHWLPAVAEAIQRPASVLSVVLNLAAVGCILATQYQLLLEIGLPGLIGMLVLLVASWGAGWLLGGSAPGTIKAMTLTAALRNVGVGLVIATGSLADTPAVTAVLAFGLLGILGSALLALAWGRGQSLVTEGLDGVEAGGLPGGVVAEHQPHRHGDGYRAKDGGG